jgi:chromate transporter
MVTPSLIIITIIAIFFTRFQENIYVQRAFAGIRVAVSMLLLWTVTPLTQQTIKNLFGILVAVSAFSLVVIGGISPIPIILASAAVGIIHGYARKGEHDFITPVRDLF